MALSKHPKKAEEMIYNNVQKACKNRDQAKIFTFKSPIIYQVRYKRMDMVEAALAKGTNFKRIDAFTVETKVNKISDIY